MDKNELIGIITKQVMEKLGTGAQGENCSTGSCGCNNGSGISSGPEKWDGVGSVADLLQAGANRL